MKTKYYSYDQWEDWKNGMYRATQDDGKEERLQKAVELFCNEQELYNAMSYVAKNWKISAESTFTNKSINYQAWLGAASQCYVNKLNDLETIESWHLLTQEQQDKANAVADKVYYEWLENYKGKGLYTIFDFGVEL